MKQCKSNKEGNFGKFKENKEMGSKQIP